MASLSSHSLWNLTDMLAGQCRAFLKRIQGYTIIGADTISEVLSGNNGGEYFRLYGGLTFKVDMVLLDPLVLTDVVIFAKIPSKEILEKYGKTVPGAFLYQDKLLADDDVYYAIPSR